MEDGMSQAYSCLAHIFADFMGGRREVHLKLMTV
jgi:hypothetical protein